MFELFKTVTQYLFWHQETLTSVLSHKKEINVTFFPSPVPLLRNTVR